MVFLQGGKEMGLKVSGKGTSAGLSGLGDLSKGHLELQAPSESNSVAGKLRPGFPTPPHPPRKTRGLYGVGTKEASQTLWK